jgi:hypothetical protein
MFSALAADAPLEGRTPAWVTVSVAYQPYPPDCLSGARTADNVGCDHADLLSL